MKRRYKNMSTYELDRQIDKCHYNWMKAIRYQDIRKEHPTYLPRYERRKKYDRKG